MIVHKPFIVSIFLGKAHGYNTCGEIMKKIRLLLLLLTVLLIAFQPARAQNGSPLVLVMNIDGPIAPAVQEYLARSIKLAERQGAKLLILQLNTPGGSIDTMNKMLQEMRASTVPIVVYVAPRGAMAGSAGTMITLAGHASAMAPETIIGAASPVGGQGEDLGDTLKAKEMEALKATVRTLTERRGAEAVQLAEDTIEKARAVSASEALQAGLVDFVASDVEDLLAKLDGFTVETVDGSYSLSTTAAEVESIPLTLIETILQMLTNPNIVFILLSIGIQAIFIELSSPGGWVAGFIGVVCLAFAGYGMGILTVNWFGLLFLVIAFVLFIVDIKAPTHGALTTAGIGSFIVGSLVLFNSPGTPQFQKVSLPLVILIAILTGAMFAVIIGFAIRALKAPIRTGHESIVTRLGYATSDVAINGQVQLGGELWTAGLAEGSEPVLKGDQVEVMAVQGLRLVVRKVKK
jgi:membrane-bound serine protease (ClpP class)